VVVGLHVGTGAPPGAPVELRPALHPRTVPVSRHRRLPREAR
jgi:hypothetical protein